MGLSDLYNNNFLSRLCTVFWLHIKHIYENIQFNLPIKYYRCFCVTYSNFKPYAKYSKPHDFVLNQPKYLTRSLRETYTTCNYFAFLS